MIANFPLSRVHLLAIAHVVVGLGLAAIAGLAGRISGELELLPAVPHLAMIVSQACLLAIWAVLGVNRIGVRGVGFILGLLYLEMVMYFGTRDDDFAWLATFSSLAVVAVLLVSRIWLAPMTRLGETSVLPYLGFSP